MRIAAEDPSHCAKAAPMVIRTSATDAVVPVAAALRLACMSGASKCCCHMQYMSNKLEQQAPSGTGAGSLTKEKQTHVCRRLICFTSLEVLGLSSPLGCDAYQLIVMLTWVAATQRQLGGVWHNHSCRLTKAADHLISREAREVEMDGHSWRSFHGVPHCTLLPTKC
jgi:hypothetical protein